MTARLLSRFLVAAIVSMSVLAPAPARADEGERKIGQSIYDGLAKKGEILTGTPYNAMLDPVAERVIAAAQPLYDEPMKMFVLKGKTVNAFAVPGGYMFVYQGLLDTIRTKDQLAGVLCHEMTHVIHHDGINMMKQARQRAIGFGLAGLLVPGVGAIAVKLLQDASNVQMLHFARKDETAADLTGANVCVGAGYNPFGLVWVMEDFQQLAGHNGALEMLSNHPRDDHRIADLESHFQADPPRFAAYHDEPEYSVPLAAASSGVVHASIPLVQCPHTTVAPESDEDYASWRQTALTSFANASSISAATAVPVLDPARDRMAAFPMQTWFVSKGRAGGSTVAYDKATRTLANCSVGPDSSIFEATTDVDMPPFKVASLDPVKLTQTIGLQLGGTIEDAVAHFGPATAEPLDNGFARYAWMRTAPEGTTARVTILARDGKAVSFRRETTYPTQAAPPVVPAAPEASASPSMVIAAPAPAAEATPDARAAEPQPPANP